MNIEFHGNPKPFGIIGLIIGCFTLLFSLIPCIGFYAIIPALIAFVFCLINYLWRKKHNESKGVPLAGMIICGITIVISITQFIIFKDVYKATNEFQDAVHDAEKELIIRTGEQLLENVKEDLENDLTNDSIQNQPQDSLPK